MTDERKPGPPTSGEVGWYLCIHCEGDPIVAVLWDWDRWASSTDPNRCNFFAPTSWTPLHDYPLVSGDEVLALRAELESTREACRVAVAAQAQEDDEVEALRAEVERLKGLARAAFEAGRSGGYLKPTGDEPAWYEFEWDTFGEWEASRER